MDHPEQSAAPMPQKVGVREFRGRLTEYLRRVRGGAAFLITSHDEVIAELRPPSPQQRPRRELGALRGKIRIAPDFDTLPADILAAMEGDGDESC